MLLFAPHPAAFPAGGKHRPGQSVSPGSPGQARLSRLLPPDVELYLLRLPGRRIRENDVRRELASRYPGGSVDFDVKILARERDEKRQPWLRAAVFAARPEAAALYRRDRRPLIPGAALLSAAFRIRFPGKAGLRPALIILLSGGRLEAALFERGIMEAHLALNRQGPEEDGALPTLLEEFASRAGDGLEAAVVLDGETDRRAEALAARFKGCSVLSI
ncbi:MAG: hypothetical protein LBQ35_06990, partial [Spirochaetaceae bacterium]|nr:hypothetical protein [Spirochaetaceae bacterium]